MSKKTLRTKYIPDNGEIERLNDHSGNQRCATCVYGHASVDKRHGARPCLSCKCSEVESDD